jgi:hypothetical protein
MATQGIIRVELESNALEALAELVVVKQAGHHGAVYGILALDYQLWEYPLLANDRYD